MTMKKLIERIDSIERKQTTTLTEGLEQSVAEGRNTVIADAKKVAKGVWRIVGLGGGDHGYEWLDTWDSPIGDAWRDYFGSGASDQMEFYDYLAQNVNPQVLAQYAADVKGWINDAKFDINESTQGVAEGRGSKPDYIDLDGDGNRKETMKKAAADKKKSTVKESWTDFDDAKRAHEKAGSTVTGRPNDYTVTMADGTRKRFITKDDRRKIETLPPVAARRDDDEDDAPAKKTTKAAPPTEGGKKRGRPAGSKNKRKVSEMTESEFHQFMRGVMLIEERMSPEQKAEKERIVKGMKKSAKDLKSRYGSRWQDVMHATATKKAMESVGSKKK